MPFSIGAAKRWVAAVQARHADALARGFLLALGLIVGALLLIDPASLLHRYFQSDRPPPDRAYVARKIYQGDATRPLDIVVLGGSSMREMIPPPGAQGQAPTGLCPGRDHLLNAATSSQQPADGYAILDALPDAPRLVVVGLTGRRLVGDRRNDPYALQDQSVELPRSGTATIDALHNGQIGFMSLDFFDQLRRAQWTLQTVALSARGIRWPADDKIDDRSAYPDAPLPRDVKQLSADKLLVSAEATATNHPVAISRYWLDFADHVTAGGGRILFVFTPTSTEAAAYQAYTRSLVEGALQDIGAKHPLLDLRNPAATPLAASDFYDPIHVSHAGRDRLWPQLAAAIRQAQACAAPRQGAN